MDDADGEKIRETQRLLGQAIISLSALDMLLGHLFGRLGMPFDVAQSIYLSIDGIAKRRQMVDAVVKLHLKTEPPLLREWDAIYGEHTDLFAKRNRLLHDAWAFDAQAGKFSLLRQMPPNKFNSNFIRDVTDDELEDVTVRANALTQRMVRFFQSLIERDKAALAAAN